MSGPIPLRFVRSFGDVDDLPATDAEVALVGRSNVGKSSLLNAVAHRKELARTSKSPGATRSINAFEAGPEGSRRWLVDLPGYGFAAVSKAEQRRWATMIDAYLTEREELTGVIVLVDGEIGPTASDLEAVAWLRSLGLEPAFVATKADKVRPSRSKKRRGELAERLGVARGEVTWVSARTGAGVTDVRRLVLELLGMAP